MSAGPIEPRELAAGRELDALVAEKVMGAVRPDRGPYWLYPDSPKGARSGSHTLPFYSGSMTHAWEVVENMARRGWKVDVQNRFRPRWACHVFFPAPDYRHVYEHGDGEYGAALAICRAALKAVES